MKLQRFNLRSFQIASIVVLILCSCSLSFAQEKDDKDWSRLKKELLDYSLQKQFDPQAFLNRYKEAVSKKTVVDLIQLADSEPVANDPPRACFVLRFVQFIARQLDDKELEGICFSKLGEIAHANDEYELAVEYYLKGRELLILTESPEAISLLLNFASLQLTRERYGDARSSVEEALRLIEKHKGSEFLSRNSNFESDLQAMLGEISYKEGQYGKAVSILKSAVNSYEKRKLNSVDLLSYCEALRQLGKSYRTLGQYDQALSYFNQALQKGKDSLDDAFYPNTLNSIALLYMEERNYDSARKLLTQSLDLYEKRKITFEKADVFLNLGVISVRLREPLQAIKYFEESYALYEKNRSQEGVIASGNGLGTAYCFLGDYGEASNWYDKSLSIAERQQNNLRLAEIYWHISELNLDKGDWPEAISTGLKALSFNHTQSNPNLFYLVNTTIGRAFLKQGDYQNSERYLKEAIRSIEEARSGVSGSQESLQLFFVDKLEAYRSLIDVLVSQGRFREALTFSERAKARVLYDSFQIRKGINEGKETNFIRVTSIPTLDRDAIRSLVNDKDTAYLMYVFADEKIYLFVLTGSEQGESIQVFPLKIKSNDLEKQVAKFTLEVANHGLLFIPQGKALYELLVGPAKELIGKSQRLVIAPDGYLWNLPFQALMDEENKYLLEKYELSYMPSLAVAVEIRRKKELRQRTGSETKNELLAVGNPLHSNDATSSPKRFAEKFFDLPEAETEVLSLAKVYNRETSKILVKEKALEPVIKSAIQNYRILHFATHGLLYKEHPLTSSLVLAKDYSPKNSDDGLLTGEEIINLRLSADLVVLSACESGQGEVTNGEGMVGLSWAFIYAGASNVVASQWKVDSQSTSELMVEFHRELTKQRGNKEKGRPISALRVAALKLKEREGYKHPFYWASFIAIGPGN